MKVAEQVVVVMVVVVMMVVVVLVVCGALCVVGCLQVRAIWCGTGGGYMMQRDKALHAMSAGVFFAVVVVGSNTSSARTCGAEGRSRRRHSPLQCQEGEGDAPQQGKACHVRSRRSRMRTVIWSQLLWILRRQARGDFG